MGEKMYAAMLKNKLVLAVDEERAVLNKEKRLNLKNMLVRIAVKQ